jgi:kynureninase
MASALTPDVALVVSSHVHYRTAVINDVAAITDAAHAVGAVVVWDVSHSVGALPLTLGTDRVDFAVGCTYKYLNGGPGAPAFCMVAERWHQYLGTPITGWLGHRRPFDFAERFEPAEGLRRLVTGTPPVTALRALDVALDAFDPRDLPAVRRKAQVLGELFVRGVHHATGGELRQVSPADPTHRGNHVSFAHPQAYGLVQALAARGVIGDFRTPDVARFGFAPLYLRHADTFEATQRLDEVWRNREYRDPAYATRADVT